MCGDAHPLPCTSLQQLSSVAQQWMRLAAESVAYQPADDRMVSAWVLAPELTRQRRRRLVEDGEAKSSGAVRDSVKLGGPRRALRGCEVGRNIALLIAQEGKAE